VEQETGAGQSCEESVSARGEPELSRRELLLGGFAAAGAIAARRFGASGWDGRSRRHHGRPPPGPVARRGPDSLPFPNLPAGTDTLPQIEHVIVLMMENHSYDNYLGMLGTGRHRRGDGFTLGRDGLPTATNPYGNGTLQRAFHMPTSCQLDAHPSQEWKASHEQYDGGRLDGFVTSPSGPVAMGYWTGADLPFYYSLASTFPVCDRWFCSVLGQTFPNRRYLIAGTSAGMVDDVASQLSTQPPNGTIFDRLDQYGISWRDYFHTSSSPTTGVYLSDAANKSPNLVSVDSFFVDAAAGTLPGFAIVDPEFSTGSEENPQDIAVGEAFAAQVVDAVMSGPAWPRTLLVWTYDEHGGYFDHVPPPQALAPDSIGPIVPPGESAYDGFHRYGFRVPSVVVSPYSRPNWVTSVVHDHTSVLAMLERKWNLPALTFRDANAADLTDFLDLRRPHFLEPPRLARPAQEPEACEMSGPGQIPPPGSVVPAP
jgi:phospholipase C